MPRTWLGLEDTHLRAHGTVAQVARYSEQSRAKRGDSRGRERRRLVAKPREIDPRRVVTQSWPRSRLEFHVQGSSEEEVALARGETSGRDILRPAAVSFVDFPRALLSRRDRE